jgi:hypothetical protein
MSFPVRQVYGKYLTEDVLTCVFSVVAPALGKKKFISLLRHLIFRRRVRNGVSASEVSDWKKLSDV